jgi:hypothetical protein
LDITGVELADGIVMVSSREITYSGTAQIKEEVVETI